MPLTYRRNLNRKLTPTELDGNWDYVISSANQSFTQSGTGGLTSTVEAALKLVVHTSQYDTNGHYVTARDALTGTLGFGKFDSAASTIGRTIHKARSLADGLPNTETGAPWLRMEYDDPDTSSPRTLEFSFYQYGQIIRFTGDGSTASNASSVLEFWGAGNTGLTYYPLMTLVTAADAHEVHVARNQGDVDAIICAYWPGSYPVIYTESGQSAKMDLGVRRLRKVQVNTTNFNLVSGHALGWTNSTTDPGATVDIALSRISAGVLQLVGTSDEEFLVGAAAAQGSAGYSGVRASGSTGAFFELMTGSTRSGSVYNDANRAISLISIGGALPVDIEGGNSAGIQMRVAMTSGSVNYPIVTGAASGANASIKASAENLLFGSGSALATTATAGYVMFPSCAGTPTGVPTGQGAGKIPMIFDTTGVKLWFYTGGAWKGVVVA